MSIQKGDCLSQFCGKLQLSSNVEYGIRAIHHYRWVQNFSQNISFLDKGKSIAELEGTRRDVACYVVAPGPSLCFNGQALRDIKKGVILTFNEGLGYLQSISIKPDCAILIDGCANTGTLFSDIDTADIPLVSTPFVHPSVLQQWKGHQYFYHWSSKFDPLYLFEERYPQFAQLDCGWDVGAAAFAMAAYLGCNPIVFVGADFSDRDGKSHWNKQAPKRSYMCVGRDVNNAIVPTIMSLVNALTSFKLMTEYWTKKGRAIINASEGGIWSKGVTCTPLCDVILRCNNGR